MTGYQDSNTNSDSWIGEVGEILAAGLMRVLARKSSQTSAESGDSSLDISPGESGHPATRYSEKPHE
jgi:hypothetical protein